MIVVSSRLGLLVALGVAAACNLPFLQPKKVVAPPRQAAPQMTVKQSKDGMLLATRGAQGMAGLAVQLWGPPGGACPAGAWRRQIAGEWVCHADFFDDKEAVRALAKWRDSWPQAAASSASTLEARSSLPPWSDVFARRRKRPRPALMVVVGDARGETLTTARALVDRLNRSSVEISSFSEPRKGPSARILRGDPALELLLPLPPLADADAPSLELLARVLASRSYAGAGKLRVRLHWRREAGLFEIRWPATKVTVEEIKNLVRFVSRLGESGPTAVELARARATNDAERGRQLQSPHGRARRLAFYHRHGAGAALEALFARRAQEVTSALVRDVAKRFFRPERFFLRLSHAGRALVSEADARQALGAYARREAPALEVKGGGLRAATLPGGARLLVEVDKSAPWVAFRLAWRAGGSLEGRNESGISKLIAATLTREIRQRHGDELRAVGGALDAVSGLDFFGLRAAGPAQHWERVLELLADVARRGPSDGASFRAAHGELIRRALKAEVDPAMHLGQLFVRQVFGDHSYALPAEGRSSALARMNLARLQRYHRRRHQTGRLVLSVVGNVDAGQVAAKAARLLGETGLARAASTPALVALPTWQSATRVETSASARLVHLALAYPAPARGRADHALFEVLARVLRARAQRDPAIAPFSLDLRLVGGLLGGALVLRVGAPADKAQEVLEALTRQVGAMRASIPADEIMVARRETLRRLRRRFEGQAGRAALHAMDALARAPEKRVAVEQKVISQANASRLRVVANRYLRSEARVVVALQPAELSPGAELRLRAAPERRAPTPGKARKQAPRVKVR